MNIPKLKRIRISSEEDLRIWLAGHSGQEGSVMLVTSTKAASRPHVSRAQVGDALAAHGWIGGPRYTLNATLVGHVITRPARALADRQRKTGPLS